MTAFRVPALSAAAALCLGLAGCISVFPKSAPAQLYAFGADQPSSGADASVGSAFNILRAVTRFAPAAAGDRILTTDGQKVAYIAGNRWVSPASSLFDQAETRAFEAGRGPARLVGQGEIVGASAELRLDVQTFEARYAGGQNTPPTVVVQVRAVLINLADRRLIGAKTFESRQSVSANRMGLIVQGFDAATSDVLSQIVAWTDGQGAKG